MVAIGLFGGISVAMMSLFGSYLRESVVAENQAQLSESMNEFQERLDVELGNTTQLVDCSCGTRQCVFAGTTNPNCLDENAPCGKVILRWETELSNLPSDPSRESCVGGKNAKTQSDLQFRGCKRRLRLVIEPPVKGAGKPGEVRIESDEKPNDGDTVAEVLARLKGSYELRCGRGSVNSVSEFRLDLKAKARANNSVPGSPEFEGFHPADAGFRSGTHRSALMNFSFRNLNSVGVHYGRSLKILNCVRDGEKEESGRGCCSGFIKLSGICLPVSECLGGGMQSDNSGKDCCSLSLMPGSNECV